MEEVIEVNSTFQKVLANIAQRNFHTVTTLETRGMDSLDFHDVSVWSIHQALQDAFIAGMTVGAQLKADHTI